MYGLRTAYLRGCSAQILDRDFGVYPRSQVAIRSQPQVLYHKVEDVAVTPQHGICTVIPILDEYEGIPVAKTELLNFDFGISRILVLAAVGISLAGCASFIPMDSPDAVATQTNAALVTEPT